MKQFMKTVLGMTIALALVFSLGTIAFATGTAPTTFTASPSPTPTSTPTSTPTLPPDTGSSSGQTQTTSDKNTSSDDAISPEVFNKGDPAFISTYRVTDLNGNEITGNINPGDHFNLSVYIRDESNIITYMKLTDIKAKINSSSFSCATLGEANYWALADDIEAMEDGELPIQQYWILFRDVTYNGGSTDFQFDLSYDGVTSMPVQHMTLTLNQMSSGHTPSLIVREANYGGQVYAGQEFNLTLTLFSSIGEESLTDVIVSLNLPEDVSLVSSKQSICISSMEPRSTATATFRLTTASNIAASVANIGVNMNATGTSSYTAVSGTGTVSIPISQPERFEITGVEAPGTMMLGEEQYVTLTYVNKGKREISNLSASISGENLANPGQSQYLGNVASGTEKSVEFSVMANEVGVMNGTITLTYENNKGEEVSLTKDYSITVEEMPVWDQPIMDDPSLYPDQTQTTGVPLWILLVAGAAVIVVLVVVIRKVKKIRARKAAEKELLEEASVEELQPVYRPIPPAAAREEPVQEKASENKE